MEFYAHTKENEPKEKWQQLSDHLNEVAKLSASFAVSFNGESHAKIAGLLHDLGKYQNEFQYYLEHGGARGSVPHAIYGALLCGVLLDQGFKPSFREISFVIDGHHGGLPDKGDWESDHMILYEDKKEQLKKILSLCMIDLGIQQSDIAILEQDLNNMPTLERELFTRLLFSTLTDADWLDTERFMDAGRYNSRKTAFLGAENKIKILDDLFSTFSKVGDLNQLRNKVRKDALVYSNMETGFFSLNLPTGMGKTLTSLYWALKHAEYNSLKRIIIVLPFISIIDQTAQILKDLFGEENVLEHHSNVSVENKTFAESSHDYRRLACENWDYPVIVTTTVQFFESLFSNKPSKCRKLHNIADSVVIFDEVQTLPKEFVQPTITMLKNISSLVKTSFLFCTATMPAYETRERFHGIDDFCHLVNNPEQVFRKIIRVKYHTIDNLDPVSSECLYQHVTENNDSALVIFNTKKTAAEFFEQCDKEHWTTVKLLTTSICPHHRRIIIDEIRTKLKDSTERILIVSTQLIEAGVDFDFPSVYRAIAPLESIIQSAGRCNREGKMQQPGNVYIFIPENNAMPDTTYGACAAHAKSMIQRNPERLHEYGFFAEYYRSVISLFVDPDIKEINKHRESFDFKTVNNLYRLIKNQTELLFVKDYNDQSRQLYKRIQRQKYLSRNDYREIQQYSVQIYPNILIKYSDNFIEHPAGVKIWTGMYNDRGLVLENIKSESLVI